jgi:signal transduction histidine kinase
MNDLMFMITVTAVACLIVGVVGWLVLHALRRRSVTLSVAVCALVPVVAVIVAVQVNVQAMFLSDHDADVITVVLSTAAVLAVALAVVLGRRLAAGSRLIGARLGRLTQDYDDGASPDRPASAELAAITAQLDAVHRTLAASRAREQALESSRRDLVTALSHDLRTPLAGVRALAEGLEDGVVDDVPSALAQIRANTERMARMADDLFELSRLRAVPPNSRDTLVSLRELAEDVAAEARPAAEAGDVGLTVAAAGRLPVRGDGDELTRALANVVANAVRHTPAGGEVAITAVGNRGTVEVTVVDGCGGIAETDLPRVFEPGWRGEPGRSQGSGTGFGLAVVEAIVSAHGGRVQVRNAGAGCEFVLTMRAG